MPLPNSTPWQVLCADHGPVALTRAQYEDQMMAADSLWKCPHCMQPAQWDDENYEKHLEAQEKFDDDTLDEYPSEEEEAEAEAEEEDRYSDPHDADAFDRWDDR